MLRSGLLYTEHDWVQASEECAYVLEETKGLCGRKTNPATGGEGLLEEQICLIDDVAALGKYPVAIQNTLPAMLKFVGQWVETYACKWQSPRLTYRRGTKVRAVVNPQIYKVNQLR
jgi:hypothetical protein